MKKNEKIMIGVLVAITVIVLIVAVNRGNKKDKEGNNENVAPEEEFVNVLEDGTRLNKSDKLHEKKEFDGMEITDFQLTEKDNVTLLLGTITNTSNEKKGGYPVNIKVVDKQGNEIITVAAFFGELEPGQSKEITLILTKQMTENNTGLVNNTAEIAESYNELGLTDVNSTEGNKVDGENDMSSADVIISIKTGEVVTTVLLFKSPCFFRYCPHT